MEIGQCGIDIREFQIRDEYYIELRTKIKELKDFVLHEDLVCKVKGSDRPRVVLPVCLRGVIIELYHANRFAGHLGLGKTSAKIAERFYWPGMHKEIAEYLKKCLKCKLHKLPLQNRFGLLKPLNPAHQGIPLAPGTCISADLLGPFPESIEGNRFIIVVSDILTRYVIAGAIKSGTAEDVAEFLVNKVICIYGAFRILLTDTWNNSEKGQPWRRGPYGQHECMISLCEIFFFYLFIF